MIVERVAISCLDPRIEAVTEAHEPEFHVRPREGREPGPTVELPARRERLLDGIVIEQARPIVGSPLHAPAAH